MSDARADARKNLAIIGLMLLFAALALLIFASVVYENQKLHLTNEAKAEQPSQTPEAKQELDLGSLPTADTQIADITDGLVREIVAGQIYEVNWHNSSRPIGYGESLKVFHNEYPDLEIVSIVPIRAEIDEVRHSASLMDWRLRSVIIVTHPKPSSSDGVKKKISF